MLGWGYADDSMKGENLDALFLQLTTACLRELQKTSPAIIRVVMFPKTKLPNAKRSQLHMKAKTQLPTQVLAGASRIRRCPTGDPLKSVLLVLKLSR